MVHYGDPLVRSALDLAWTWRWTWVPAPASEAAPCGLGSLGFRWLCFVPRLLARYVLGTSTDAWRDGFNFILLLCIWWRRVLAVYGSSPPHPRPPVRSSWAFYHELVFMAGVSAGCLVISCGTPTAAPPTGRGGSNERHCPTFPSPKANEATAPVPPNLRPLGLSGFTDACKFH